MADDQWFTRDLPVLDAIAPKFDGDPAMVLRDIDVARLTERPVAEVQNALDALHRGRYVDAESSRTNDGDFDIVVTGLTERGRRATGMWPADALTAIAAALEQAASSEQDAETKTRMQHLAAWFRDTAKSGSSAAIGQAVGVGTRALLGG